MNIRVLKSTNWTEDAGFHAVESWLRLSTARQEHIDVVQAQFFAPDAAESHLCHCV